MHLSDVSWDDDTQESIRNFSKGDEIETVVLGVDSERERISLGIKQLEEDIFSKFAAKNQKGEVIKGVVKNVNQDHVVVNLIEGVDGLLKASEISLEEEVVDARTVFKEGDKIEVKITGIDNKKRLINLSIKEKELDDEQTTVQEYNPETGENSKLGDILKEHLEK